MMRDHSAQPPHSKNTPSSTMPLDKQNSGIAAKPFTPTLSSAFRNPKSSLTPRLAGSKNASPVSPPRRALRSETAPPPSRREGFRSPTNSKLDGNVTPRSGARVSRIEVNSPATPGSNGRGIPSRTRPLSAIELSKPCQRSETGARSDISTPENKHSTTSAGSNVASAHTVSGGLQRRISTGGQQNAAAKSVSSGLFQANGIHPSSSEPERTPDVGKKAAFFYASDAGRRTNSPEGLRTTSDLSLEQGRRDGFRFANDRPTDLQLIYRTQGLNVKAEPDTTSSPTTFHGKEGVVQVQPYPLSPRKTESVQSAPTNCTSLSGSFIKSELLDSSTQPNIPGMASNSHRWANANSKTSMVREMAQRSPPDVNSTPTTPPRRSYLHTSPKAATFSNGQRQTAIPVSPIEGFSPRTSLSSSNTGVSAQSLETPPSDSIQPLGTIKGDFSQSAPLHNVNELAASARRERKVLDLEISNSSLLAINRTLESEMQKQSTELRRFRRLSRSGRFSMASNSVRSTSGLSTVTRTEEDDGIHVGLSDLGEEISISECDEDDLASSLDDDSSSLHSPTSRIEYDNRHRLKDEKRLMLDLSKHQHLLVDSQKMNQSIRRCLGWTEELISDGKKALEYNVKVSDVELGGRVLPNDHKSREGEVVGEGGGSGSKALLSPSLPTPISPKEDTGRRLWRQGLEEIETEVDKMLESSSTLKQEIPISS